MPGDSKKPQSFDPAQPAIPGVPRARAKDSAASASPEAPAANRRPLFVWAGASAAILILIVAIIWWARGVTRVPPPAPAAHVAAPALPLTPPAPPAPPLPIAPGPVATVEELARPWAAKEFLYRRPSAGASPAMIVHLTGNTYWAFSLQAPYGACQLELITNLATLRSRFKFSASHPMLVDPCRNTVYDLARYGAGPNGLVRGAVVAGSGIRPPLAIEVQIHGQEILATHAEQQ